MRTILGAVQHGFGLLLLDTGVAERKGEFLTTAHGQDRVEQADGGKNIHGGEAKIRLQGLVEGLRDDLQMTNRVGAVLVHPGVEGGRRWHPHSVFPHPPRRQHAGPRHRFARPKRPRGVPGVVRDRRSSVNVARSHRCRPSGPIRTPIVLWPCNWLGAGPCVWREWPDTVPPRFCLAQHNA